MPISPDTWAWTYSPIEHHIHLFVDKRDHVTMGNACGHEHLLKLQQCDHTLSEFSRSRRGWRVILWDSSRCHLARRKREDQRNTEWSTWTLNCTFSVLGKPPKLSELRGVPFDESQVAIVTLLNRVLQCNVQTVSGPGWLILDQKLMAKWNLPEDNGMEVKHETNEWDMYIIGLRCTAFERTRTILWMLIWRKSITERRKRIY